MNIILEKDRKYHMDLNLFYNILLSDKPSYLIKKNEEYFFSLIPELKTCKGFNQNSKWHIYDVYEHILHVVDGVESDLVLRLAALFHDVGKPICYTVDESGNGHFYNHWYESYKIFLKFAREHEINRDTQDLIAKLILYHDVRIDKISDDAIDKIFKEFNHEEVDLLYKIKKADLLAQSSEFHNELDAYESHKQYLYQRINELTFKSK